MLNDSIILQPCLMMMIVTVAIISMITFRLYQTKKPEQVHDGTNDCRKHVFNSRVFDRMMYDIYPLLSNFNLLMCQTMLFALCLTGVGIIVLLDLIQVYQRHFNIHGLQTDILRVPSLLTLQLQLLLLKHQPFDRIVPLLR